MNKQPQLMDVARMRDILSSHLSQMREHVFLNSELTMVRGNHTVFSLLMRQKPPFAINDYRLGLIMSGEIDININLQDRHLTSGTLVYIGPGTIIYPKRLSADLRIFGMGLFSNFPMPFAQGQMPSAFNGQVRDFQLPASEEDIATAQHILNAIWQTVHASDDYHRPTVTALVAAQMHHYNHLFHQQTDSSRSREQTIFDRFLQLVTQHCAEHHQIGYYAEACRWYSTSPTSAIKRVLPFITPNGSYVHSLAYGWANNRTHYFPKNSLGVSPVMRLKRRVKW